MELTSPAGVYGLAGAKAVDMAFRAIISDALRGRAVAQYLVDQRMKNRAIIHMNSDVGVNMIREFTEACHAVGGEIATVTLI
ncbi:hypothetical protein [Paracoccus sediminilitoris]|uniref:hypothetical protein n=1 Tax=Paracoccus sediminilitoris TaxID=2202419 RepID=UPI00272BD84E|nr:hypothetical protein [Paracoccus sediminilitoris]